jgi:hypothetical protein
MSTITIPAAVIPRLRDGVQQQLAHAAETIKDEAEAYEKDTPPLEARAETDRAWALLDALGWAGGVPDSIDVDVREHGNGLRAAIDSMVTSLSEVIAELPDGDPIRAERVEELQALREFEGAALRAIESDRTEPRVILVPADVAVQLRGALFADLSRAGADLEEACSTTEPGDFAAPVGKLRRLFAVLDDIGWVKETVSPEALTIDHRHLRVVVDTLEDDREGWEWTSEQPQLEDLPGRERAKATAETIERFLAAVPSVGAMLTLPPVLVGLIAEGAQDLPPQLAQAIDCGRDLRECAAQLTAVAGLLDALDTEDTDETVELDLAEHGRALRCAVAVMLPVLEQAVADTKDGDPAKPKREDHLRLVRQLAVQVHAPGGGE